MERPDLIHTTARYRSLDKLLAYYESRQYENRPDWWTGDPGNGEIVPLRERRPCIIYPLPKAAVHQLVRFTIGTEAWPTLKVEDERVPEMIRERVAKSISDVIAHCKIKPAIRALMARALAARTAVAVFGLRAGKLRIDTPRAQDCVPVFEGDDPCQPVKSLTWVYQYDREVEEPSGIVCKKFWFRRDIDEIAVVEYEPEEVRIGSVPVWRVAKETQHGFGFCPVLWIRNMPEVADGSIDGVSIYEDQFDQFDALNFALSQRNRGIYFFGTPQPYETGVAEDDGPEAEGRKGRSKGGPKGFSAGGSAPLGQVAAAARRMAPDYMWSYRDPNVSVALVETTGRAYEVTSKHVDDIRSRILESIGVVLVNANNILTGSNGAELSGRFLELAYAPMLAHVDDLRDACWWDNILDVISMVMRIVATVDLGQSRLRIPAVAEMQDLFRQFFVNSEWIPPTLTPLWGSSFSLTAEETQKQVAAADAAHKAQLISQETAVRYVAPAFGVQDIRAEIDAESREVARQPSVQASPILSTSAADIELEVESTRVEVGPDDEEDEDDGEAE